MKSTGNLLRLAQALEDGKDLVMVFSDGVKDKIETEQELAEMFFKGMAISILKPKKYRAWKSIEEMGEAVNHWFRLKEHYNVLRKIGIMMNHNEPDCIDFCGEEGSVHTYLNNLLDSYEHSPDLKTWLPCGVEE